MDVYYAEIELGEPDNSITWILGIYTSPQLAKDAISKVVQGNIQWIGDESEYECQPELSLLSHDGEIVQWVVVKQMRLNESTVDSDKPVFLVESR